MKTTMTRSKLRQIIQEELRDAIRGATDGPLPFVTTDLLADLADAVGSVLPGEIHPSDIRELHSGISGGEIRRPRLRVPVPEGADLHRRRDAETVDRLREILRRIVVEHGLDPVLRPQAQGFWDPKRSSYIASFDIEIRPPAGRKE